MSKILDIEISHNHKRYILQINQMQYLTNIITRIHISTNIHRLTKSSINKYKVLWPAGSSDMWINQHEYQHAIELLMYVAIYRCSDITFLLEYLSQYLSNLAEHYKYALKHLLYYVQFILNLDIVYIVSGKSDLIG